MPRYFSRNLIRIFLSMSLWMICGISLYASMPLTEKDRHELAGIARRHYDATMMDGASVFRFKGRDILLVVVEVKKSPNAQRIGQVKASRSAGEFLQSATNRSVTVYKVSDGSSYSMQDKAMEQSKSSGSSASNEISQGVGDMTTTATEENFSDEIVQSSITRVGHIQPLCRLATDGTTVTFAYSLII